MASSERTYTRIVLAERPTGDIIPDKTFARTSAPLAALAPGAGEVLVRVDWVQLDPAMRGWMNDARSYLPPVEIGAAMRASGLGTVVQAGAGSTYAPGDIVTGFLDWQEYAVLKDKQVQKIVVPTGATALDFLGPLGSSGMTAYFGLFDVGQLKAGETLVVSGAAGSVGSLVCQLGKKRGARVLAIAGSDEKCRWLETLGVDAAVNYKSADFHARVKAFGYIDVYFDNVGGAMLDFMLTRLNKGARIPLCGGISDYNQTPAGLRAYLNLISQRAKLEGFLVMDYAARFGPAIAEMAGWLADGSLQRKFHVVAGLANAPAALPLLFTGGNTGKLVIKVSDVDADVDAGAAASKL